MNSIKMRPWNEILTMLDHIFLNGYDFQVSILARIRKDSLPIELFNGVFFIGFDISRAILLVHKDSSLCTKIEQLGWISCDDDYKDIIYQGFLSTGTIWCISWENLEIIMEGKTHNLIAKKKAKMVNL